jgi:hypothetical protein
LFQEKGVIALLPSCRPLGRRGCRQSIDSYLMLSFDCSVCSTESGRSGSIHTLRTSRFNFLIAVINYEPDKIRKIFL